ncbi:MAG TPA: hypothetical protein RMH99_24155 [Sandaracinaceae bacterium LLY-WYZ-13_1]|nr:hypothetical protein [Sandaracinaceae bacterium LLY-WYZ-13_1]
MGQAAKVSAEWVETALDTKRVTADDLNRVIRAYGTRPAETLFIDAEPVKSFAPDAIPHAVESFARLHRRHGLARIVAILRSPVVRMGAATVSMSLRSMQAPVEIVVVGDRDEARRLLERPTGRRPS